MRRYLAHLRGMRLRRRPAQADDEGSPDDDVIDKDYWTVERKLAVIKEALAGRMSAATAAREYAIPEAVIEQWLDAAEQGIVDALAGKSRTLPDDPAKVRALARAYKKLQDENRELKAQRAD